MTSIALAQQGLDRPSANSRSNFDQLAGRYSRDLFNYAYWLSGDRHTAEDLVQDTLIRAWKSLDKLQNPKAIKGWLLTIVRRENARRFERYQPQVSDIPPEEIGAKGKDYDTSAEAFVLRRAVRELPEQYREPLLLQVIHGYSQQEIAERLGLSCAGVGTHLFRARQKLREALGENP